MAESSAGSLTAVFFVDLSPASAATLNAWTASGHRALAVVSYQAKRGRSGRYRRDRLAAFLAPRWSVSAAIRRHRILYLQLSPPVNWDAVAERLTKLQADCLVSIGFQRLIPPAVIAGFRHGGVNVHPSLLPAYRGPYPIHAIVRDRAIARFGGTTLHRMGESFDAGEIISQEPLGQAAYAERPEEGFVLARTVARQVSTDLPSYCAGQCKLLAQRDGDWPTAQLDSGPLLIGARDTVKRFLELLAVFVPSPGIAVRIDDRVIDVGALKSILSSPAGKRPVVRRFTMDVDLADARVRLVRENAVLRRWRRLKGMAKMIREPAAI